MKQGEANEPGTPWEGGIMGVGRLRLRGRGCIRRDNTPDTSAGAFVNRSLTRRGSRAAWKSGAGNLQERGEPYFRQETTDVVDKREREWNKRPVILK